MAHPPLDSERLVFFGAHRWRRQVVIAKARAFGFEPHIAMFESEHLEPDLQACVKPSHIHRMSILSPTPVRDVLATIPRNGRWYTLGLDDYVMELASRVSEYSAMPTMEPNAAVVTLHKSRLRHMWNSLCGRINSLYLVPYILLRYKDCTFSELEEDGDAVRFSSDSGFIVKPNALDASISIHSASDWAGVEVAITEIQAELSPLAESVLDLGIVIAPEIIVEKRIPRSTDLHAGAEFSAEFISIGGQHSAEHQLLGITQKYIDNETHVEVAHCHPSHSFPPELVPVLVTAVRSLLSELRVGCTISHWEFIVTPDRRLALVEGQLRPAGDNIMELVRLSSGFDPYELLFTALRGHIVSIASRQDSSTVATVHFLRPECEIHAPLVLSSSHPGSALGSESLIVSPDFAAASRWGCDSDWGNRYIGVITAGPNFDAARKSCEKIVEGLTLKGCDAFGQPIICGLRLPSLA
jgi:hypothetical protein